MARHGQRPPGWVHLAACAAALLSISPPCAASRAARSLGDGDWAPVVNLLKLVTFKVPPQHFQDSAVLGLGSVEVSLPGGDCNVLGIGDIAVSSNLISNNTQMRLTADVTSVAARCHFLHVNYMYNLIGDHHLVNGHVDVHAGTQDATMKLAVVFSVPEGKSLVSSFPTSAVVESADVHMTMPELHFHGGFTADIIDKVKPLFRGKIESSLSSVLKDKLSELAGGKLTELLGIVNNETMPFLAAPPAPDRLAGEPSVQHTPGLVNLTGSVVSSIAATATKNFLSVGDPLGINMVVDKVTKDGSFGVGLNDSIYHSSDALSTTSVRITGFSVGGIDRFVSFDPVAVIGDHTVRTRFVLNQLEVMVHAEVTLGPTDQAGGAESKAGTVVEKVTANMQVGDVSVDAALLLAVNETAAGNLTIGSLYHHPLPCAVQPFVNVSVTDFNVDVGRVTSPRLTGFISGGLDRLFNQAAFALYTLYEPTARAAVPGVAALKLRPALNSALRGFLTKQWADVCPAVTRPAGQPSVNFVTDVLFRHLRQALNGALQTVDLNTKVIDPLTTNQSGVAGRVELKKAVSVKVHTRPGKTGIMLDADAEMSAFRVDGLDTVTNVTLLGPKAPNKLTNSVELGAPGGRPVTVSADFNVGVRTSTGFDLRDDFTVSLNESGIKAVIDLLAQVDVGALQSVQLRQTLSPECWLATLQRGGLDDLVLAFDSVRLSVGCRNCTSPGISNLHRRAQRPSSASALTHAVNSALRGLADVLLGSQSEEQFQKRVQQASARCAGVYAPPLTVKSSGTSTAVYVAVGLAAAAALVLGLRWHRRRVHSYEQLRLGDDDGRGRAESRSEVELTSQMGSSFFARGSSTVGTAPGEPADCSPLIENEALSPAVRYGVMVALVCTIFMFISGHVSTGASVDLTVTLAGETLKLQEFAKFSLSRSVADMWHAKAYFLALLVGCFSGVWPYAKVLLLVWVWWAPRVYPPADRGWLLRLLDWLGKLSLIDVFVLTMTMVGFRLRVTSPAELVPVLGTDFYAAEVVVTPYWGLYAFMTAATASLVINVAMVRWHDRVASGKQRKGPESGSLQPSFDKDFEEPRQACCPMHRLLMVTAVVTSMLLTTLGSSLPVFSFRKDGLAGVAIDAGVPGSAETRYSLFSIVTGLMEQSEMPGQSPIGIAYIVVSYLAFAYVVPMLQLTCCLLVLCVPVSCGLHERLMEMEQMLSPFAATEVFWAGVVVTVAEIGQVSSFLLDDACKPLQSTFNDVLIPYGFLPRQDGVCFRVSASLLSGAYVLPVGIAASCWSVRFVRKFTGEHFSAGGTRTPLRMSFGDDAVDIDWRAPTPELEPVPAHTELHDGAVMELS
eukprot:TRINITY_DN39325_c0_g1_i1.p1 TRINITY_DN39325_c0_g1~~TRINITY_DN39325_c0_g1_i1.p1  ORF type:complete len:1369 (+),score=407.72 TRINITY_DN39325_c0_g1_i1:55-4107(+)